MDLLKSCRPTTIFWRVVSIIVDAVERLSAWPVAHVSKKILKFMPALADLDAATAVVDKIRRGWIFAAVKHARPTDVGSWSFAIHQMAVAWLRSCWHAAARFGVTVAKAPAYNTRCVSTLAATKPKCLAVPASDALDNGQAPKTSFREIDNFGHVDLVRRLFGLSDNF